MEILKNLENFALNEEIYYLYKDKLKDEKELNKLINEILNEQNQYINHFIISTCLDIQNYHGFDKYLMKLNKTVLCNHLMINKLTIELRNFENTEEDIKKVIDLYFNRLSRLENPGRTLAYGYGFLLGRMIGLNYDIEYYYNKIPKENIEKQAIVYGLLEGVKKGYLLDTVYKYGFLDRYKNASESSKFYLDFLSKKIPNKELEIKNYKINEKSKIFIESLLNNIENLKDNHEIYKIIKNEEIMVQDRSEKNKNIVMNIELKNQIQYVMKKYDLKTQRELEELIVNKIKDIEYLENILNKNEIRDLKELEKELELLKEEKEKKNKIKKLL